MQMALSKKRGRTNSDIIERANSGQYSNYLQVGTYIDYLQISEAG